MRFRHDVLIEIVIHRSRIVHNLGQFERAFPHLAVAPVLKSNAYGHGLVPVAKALAGSGREIPFLCVDSYIEAMILRNEGVHAPILIIGYTPLSNIERRPLRNVAFAVTSIEELRRLSSRARRRVAVHLKMDTGMHRQGILPEELDEALDLVAKNRALALEGAYSHLADADAPAESPLNKKQIARWNAAVHSIREYTEENDLPAVRYFHLGNTAGSRYAGEIDANAMRLGIGLYGMTADPNQPQLARQFGLRPALSMRSRITSVRKIAAGESVGYNATFTAKRAMTVATVPVGYAEGVDRRLSGKGTVTIGGVPCPYVGRVNMNITSVDVSRLPAAKMDDDALVISAEHDAPNSIENMAKICGTVTCELLIHLPAQIRRTVV